MHRALAIVLGASCLLAAAAPVVAGVPQRNCPNAHSGWNKVDVDGWWAESVEGFVFAGIPVYVGGDPNDGFTAAFDAFAVDFGFADGQALYEFIVGAQWDDLDANGDGFVCMKALPINVVNPGYFFQHIDNSAR